MHKATNTPAVEKPNKNTDEKLIDAIKGKNLVAANSAPRPKPAKIANDIEDMWDNLPV